MATMKKDTGTLNANAYEDKGKFVEDTTIIEILSQDAELNDEVDGEKWPDLKGKALIGGTEYYISCWYKDSHDFLSLSFKEVESERPTKRKESSSKKKSTQRSKTN